MSAIGIDLGTTYSCVAAWRHGRVHIVANERGNRTTPSYIAFDQRKRLFGHMAKNHVTKEPWNTVYDSKRFIGRQLSDHKIQENMKFWPFSLEDVSCRPRVQVEFGGEKRKFAAEEISAMVMLKMKQIAEAFVGDVKDAVIAVPVSFTDLQRQATIDAGRIAGLNVLALIHETTAAALTYGIDRNNTDKKNVLVYNHGGGHLDVAVVTIEGAKYTVKSTAGDSNLGGEDIDNVLIKYLADKFLKNETKDVYKNKKAVQRLRAAAEKAKITLTSLPTTDIQIDSLIDGVDFTARLTKERFNVLCKTFFSKTSELVEQVIRRSNLNKKDIHEVILVGGSSRIPEIQSLLQNMFQVKQLNSTVNLDEAVAKGACVLAAQLRGDSRLQIELLLTDTVTEYVSIDRSTASNSPYPCHQRRPSIGRESESELGSRSLIHFQRECRCPSAAELAEKIQVDVHYNVNKNYGLTVEAFEITDNYTRLVTYNYNNNSTSLRVKEMMNVAKNLQNIDKNEKLREDARHHLEKFTYSLRADLQDIDAVARSEDWTATAELCHSTLQWLESHGAASRDILETHMKTLEESQDNLKKGQLGKRTNKSTKTPVVKKSRKERDEQRKSAPANLSQEKEKRTNDDDCQVSTILPEDKSGVKQRKHKATSKKTAVEEQKGTSERTSNFESVSEAKRHLAEEQRVAAFNELDQYIADARDRIRRENQDIMKESKDLHDFVVLCDLKYSWLSHNLSASKQDFHKELKIMKSEHELATQRITAFREQRHNKRRSCHLL